MTFSCFSDELVSIVLAVMRWRGVPSISFPDPYLIRVVQIKDLLVEE